MVRAPPLCRAYNHNKLGQLLVNNITAAEAERSPDVVLGILPVNEISAKVLFDTGASHSFVSQSFAHLHGLAMDILPRNLMVKSPGADMMSSMISNGNQILIGGHLFLASLIILGNSDIDGKEWKGTISIGE